MCLFASLKRSEKIGQTNGEAMGISALGAYSPLVAAQMDTEET